MICFVFRFRYVKFTANYNCLICHHQNDRFQHSPKNHFHKFDFSKWMVVWESGPESGLCKKQKLEGLRKFQIRPDTFWPPTLVFSLPTLVQITLHFAQCRPFHLKTVHFRSGPPIFSAVYFQCFGTVHFWYDSLDSTVLINS